MRCISEKFRGLWRLLLPPRSQRWPRIAALSTQKQFLRFRIRRRPVVRRPILRPILMGPISLTSRITRGNLGRTIRTRRIILLRRAGRMIRIRRVGLTILIHRAGRTTRTRQVGRVPLLLAGRIIRIRRVGGISGTGFSLWGLVFAWTEGDGIKK
jgi:hypothetical protein